MKKVLSKIEFGLYSWTLFIKEAGLEFQCCAILLGHCPCPDIVILVWTLLSSFSCIKYFVQGFPLRRCADPLLNIVNVRCDIVYSGLCWHTEDEAEWLCCLMFLFCIDVFQRSINKKKNCSFNKVCFSLHSSKS